MSPWKYFLMLRFELGSPALTQNKTFGSIVKAIIIIIVIKIKHSQAKKTNVVALTYLVYF